MITTEIPKNTICLTILNYIINDKSYTLFYKIYSLFYV